MRLPVMCVAMLPIGIFACANSWGSFWKIEDPRTTTPVSKVYRLFATNPTASGNLGGATGADAICNGDPGKPNSGIYKAVLAEAGVREACVTTPYCTDPGENINWVLRPNSTYVQADGTTKVKESNSAGIFTFPLNAPFVPATERFWMGFFFGSPSWIKATTQHCVNWTSASGANFGGTGIGNITNTSAIYEGTWACNTSTYRILCAEQ